METLKGCPFCGGRAEYDNTDTGYCFIACQNCGCKTNEIYMNRINCDSEDIVIEAWNKREG
ncbi:MAG: hypothetical protein GY861_02965 [bacterium]|nr:hypothetical protein [bacterium]